MAFVTTEWQGSTEKTEPNKIEKEKNKSKTINRHLNESWKYGRSTCWQIYPHSENPLNVMILPCVWLYCMQQNQRRKSYLSLIENTCAIFVSLTFAFICIFARNADRNRCIISWNGLWITLPHRHTIDTQSFKDLFK